MFNETTKYPHDMSCGFKLRQDIQHGLASRVYKEKEAGAEDI